MKKIILIGLVSVLVLLPFNQAWAVIPAGETFYTWFDKIVTNLSELSTKMRYFGQEWGSLPSGVKSGLKTRITTSIDEAITNLTNLKTDLNAL